MHTIVETNGYLSAAEEVGVTASELEEIATIVSRDPTIGDLIQGAGGVRKFRFGGRGKGKSGGYRILSYFAGVNAPVFLLTIFSKGDRANLTAKQRATLGTQAKQLLGGYTKRVPTK